MKPARQRIAGHCLRSPSVTSVAGFATTSLASSSAMMPRKSPTPAEIANLRFFGIELMMYSRILKTEMRKNSTPEQNTPASACCQVYLWASTTVNAKNAPHARRERDRIIGIERHHQGRDRGRDAGRDEHRALVHARIAEDLRVDEDDVDHGEEGRDAGDEFGADIAAALGQAEIAIEKRSLARRLGRVGHVTPQPVERPASRPANKGVGKIRPAAAQP